MFSVNLLATLKVPADGHGLAAHSAINDFAQLVKLSRKEAGPVGNGNDVADSKPKPPAAAASQSSLRTMFRHQHQQEQREPLSPKVSEVATPLRKKMRLSEGGNAKPPESPGFLDDEDVPIEVALGDMVREALESGQPGVQEVTRENIDKYHSQPTQSGHTLPPTQLDADATTTMPASATQLDQIKVGCADSLPCRKTESLWQGMNFMKDFVLLAGMRNSDLDLDSLADTLSARTTSIAFAGVAAHDCVDRLLADVLSKQLGRLVKPPQSMYHIEYNASCQEELKLLHSSSLNPCLYSKLADEPCLFSDIHAFWRPEVLPLLENLQKKPWLAPEVLADLLMECRAVRLSAPCKRHNKVCKLRPSDRHSCGSVSWILNLNEQCWNWWAGGLVVTTHDSRRSLRVMNHMAFYSVVVREHEHTNSITSSSRFYSLHSIL